MVLKTKTISYDARIKFFWICVFFSVISLVMYMYAVNSAVRNTVARKNLENEIASVDTRLSEMEFKYISLKNKIDLSLAINRGFKEVTSPVYISRSSSRSLSYNSR